MAKVAEIIKLKNLILIATLVVLGSGCAVQTAPEEIISTPKLSEENRRIEELIKRNIPENAKFESVRSEEGLSTIKMIDIDGDGIVEILVTYALDSEKEPLHLLVFRKKNDSYSFMNDIPIKGTEFDKIEMKNLTSNGKKDLIVSTLENNSRILTVYSYQDEIKKILEMGFDAYVMDDINEDGNVDIVVFRNSGGELISDYYIYDSGDSQVKFVNDTINYIDFDSFKPAIVDKIEKNRNGIIVQGNDINNKVRHTLVYGINSDGKLENLIKDTTEEGANIVGFTSLENRNFKVSDIDGDGVVEIPRPHMMTGRAGVSTSDKYLYYTEWLRFKEDKFDIVSKYIYLDEARVYFKYPENWKDKDVMGETLKVKNGTEYRFMVEDDNNKKQRIMSIIKTNSNLGKEYQLIEEDDKEKYYIKSEKINRDKYKNLSVDEDAIIKSFKIDK